MTAVQAASPRSPRSWLFATWVLAITVLLVQRPLNAPELWWHLARGREVVGGTFAPSQQLLVLDQNNEADWLGGVPFYFGWSGVGIHALAAVPLLAALILLASVRRRIPQESRWWAAILLLPPLLWVVRVGLQPVPRLFDLFGLVALWHILNANWGMRWRLAVTLAVFCVWANFGPRPIWGLLLLALFAPKGVLNSKLAGAALFGGMMTPRGLLTWYDSAILFAPSAFETLENFEANWQGLSAVQAGEVSQVVFLLFWGGWVCYSWLGRPDLIRIIRWGVPLLAAFLCQANLPACGIWILLDVLQFPPRPRTLSAVPKRKWAGPAAALVLCLVLVDAAGHGLPPYARLGWGISQEIDPRLLDADMLISRQQPMTGWAPDARSVGVVSWLEGGMMVDHPQRALLAGRWPLHADLMDDFQKARRARYRRDDGTWGGWLQTLEAWNVDVLFLPVEANRLHQALVETAWRPADLDSATVPYVSADSSRFAQVIVEIMRQQAFVEAGPWQPGIDIYAGHGWRYDVIQWLGLGPDPAPAIRQSRLFRSLNIPLASLRALLPVRQRTWHRRLQDEFRTCQNDLAYQEWVSFGQTSDFRQLVVQVLSANSDASRTQQESEKADLWKRTVEFYLQGRISEAIQALPRRSPQQHYDAGMLWLELGQTDRARRELEQLILTCDAAASRIGAEYWLQQLALFNGP